MGVGVSGRVGRRGGLIYQLSFRSCILLLYTIYKYVSTLFKRRLFDFPPKCYHCNIEKYQKPTRTIPNQQHIRSFLFLLLLLFFDVRDVHVCRVLHDGRIVRLAVCDSQRNGGTPNFHLTCTSLWLRLESGQHLVAFLDGAINKAGCAGDINHVIYIIGFWSKD